MSANARVTTAAGAVILRPHGQVALIHRPKYDDWSFPKGKLERDEPAPVAACREVEEETGLRIRLGRPLRSQHYPTRAGVKTVHYWVGRLLDGSGDRLEGFVANGEVDRVVWLPIDRAAARLSYRRDKLTLREAVRLRKATVPMVVLRHADARARSAWQADDRERPLVLAGRRQAVAVAGILAAYDVRRILTSSSARCVQTVAVHAADAGLEPETTDLLSEEDATRGTVRKLIARSLSRLDRRGGTVVCTHRPVLPWVFEAIGAPDPQLEKGEMAVFHLRHGRVLAVERYATR
ncbi:MAG: NUDIX domain-containing protein [Nocardioides sp.]|uniref:NUDIX hydrolase n=1 Tax=Nocardioides sp. TaxID=35761 RepID=UPI0039E424A9